jgi:transcriptional regulator with XRE-family HTH domain
MKDIKRNRRNITENPANTSETPEERVARIYGKDGGPLIAWMTDEARLRGMDLQQMARSLGVTYGYINQLRSGIRSPAHIGQDFSESCAAFLGVPTIVVKILCGRVQTSDFIHPVEKEEESIERAFRRLMADPTVRKMLPVDSATLSFEARRALVLMYSETSGNDVLGVCELPRMMQYLQRALDIHDENYELAVRRHVGVQDVKS